MLILTLKRQPEAMASPSLHEQAGMAGAGVALVDE